MMHLRQPIRLPKEEPLRGLIYARFSNEEHRQSSIDDQVASCRKFQESNLPKVWTPQGSRSRTDGRPRSPTMCRRGCSKHWLKAGDRKGGGNRRRAS